MNSTLFCLVLICTVLSINAQKLRSFPKGLLFGSASSSYQVEGAWNVSDKSENIWDRLAHTRSELIKDGQNADDTIKSYEFYMRDVKNLDELGVDFYRFSISWSRLLPEGFATKISVDGLNYYNNLINALLDKGIKPLITLYHWDLPQSLQDLGGWANPILADIFQEYARVCFEKFGDRVKSWLTFNEPKEICLQGYGGVTKAPAVNQSGVGEYLCGHTLLRAHGKAYRLYEKDFKPTQKGRLGLTINVAHHEPAYDDENSVIAAKLADEFEFGWWANPIFTKDGDYPQVMKEMIAAKSKQQGYPTSRLPEFTKEDIKMLIGSADFFGINHYSAYLTALPNTPQNSDVPSFYDDLGVWSWQDPSWPESASDWLRVTPWAFRKMLNTLKNVYNNPEILVLENGFSTRDTDVNDFARVAFYHEYLNSMLDAIEFDNVNVTHYTAWCLSDNYEWTDGYTERFGLYSTNYTDPMRSQTPKESAKYYKELLRTRQIMSVN